MDPLIAALEFMVWMIAVRPYRNPGSGTGTSMMAFSPLPQQVLPIVFPGEAPLHSHMFSCGFFLEGFLRFLARRLDLITDDPISGTQLDLLASL